MNIQTEAERLQAEIEFWRYLIECRKGTVPEEVTERMLTACSLAERRLMLLNVRCPEPAAVH